jgi:hypothetical protein
LYQQLQTSHEITSARFYEQENEKAQITCSIRNLVKIFGEKKVVNGISMNLHKK